jgi:hypothetical protein
MNAPRTAHYLLASAGDTQDSVVEFSDILGGDVTEVARYGDTLSIWTDPDGDYSGEVIFFYAADLGLRALNALRASFGFAPVSIHNRFAWRPSDHG